MDIKLDCDLGYFNSMSDKIGKVYSTGVALICW